MNCRRFAYLATSLALLTALVGCPKGTVSSKGGSSRGDASAEDLLKSAIHQLQPENYAIAAASDKPVNLLNSWLDATQPPAPPKLNFPEGWISPETSARVSADNYDAQDAIHIRNSLLTHAMAVYLSERASDEVAQTEAIFDFVVRNIALPGAEAPDTPMDLYEILLLGQGTPEDRAWVCAALLRQRRLDCVIVRPAGDTDSGDANSQTDAWLLGVLLNRQIYLFDPRLGLAIPSTTDMASASTAPATLEEIAAHPEWLKQLAPRADQPYPISAEDLQRPMIQPIIEADYWSPRMHQLESALPAEAVCVLYDPLNDEAEQTGLLSRLKLAIPDWDSAKSRPWPYPPTRQAAAREFFKTRKQQRNLPIELTEPWEALDLSLILPVPTVEDETTHLHSPGRPERRLLRTRTDQLLGKFDDATQRYLPIRHLEVEPTPVPWIGLLNRIGAENAIYWTAVCKFEARQYEAAIEQLTTYLTRFERSGRWNFAARFLLAQCHAELGQLDVAATVLQRSRVEDPNRSGNAFRIKRWTAR